MANIRKPYYRKFRQDFYETLSEKGASILRYRGADNKEHYVAAGDSPDVMPGGGMVQVTWQELKDLRDSSKLVPGSLYRITDYQCTTTQENTRSAGHQFDIVLLALSANKLAEEGWAMMNESNVYTVTFWDDVVAKCYLIKDSDTQYTIVSTDTLLGSTEVGIEVDEETKTAVYEGTFESLDTPGLKYNYFAGCNLSAWKVWYCLDNDKSRFAWADPENGKGVVWRMIDEWGNDCPYDFKNIKFKRALTDGEYDPDEGEDVWCYTFTWIDEDGEAVDASVFCQNIVGDEGFVYGVHDNSMLPCIEYDFYPEEHSDKLAFALNDNVFISSYQFEDGVFYGIYGNHFSSSCHSNTFGNSCSGNTFGNNCCDNTFGNDFQNNTFGNDFQNNTFGNSCSRNSFGNDCGNNKFGNSCSRNSFGNYCYSNSFGNGCNFNSFGNYCYSNSFGNECYNNSFGNECFRNTFGNNFLSSSIGDNVNNVKVNKDYVQFILIENGNQYITITSTATTSSTFRLENFAIALGVNNGGSMKTISHNTTNDTFKTTYQNSNSTTKNV